MLEFSPSRKKGKTYEATYAGWLDFFESLAKTKERARVAQAPYSWSCFIRYIGHYPVNSENWFPEDVWFKWNSTPVSYEEERRTVEVSSAARPELVHALHLWDTEWSLYPESKARLAFYSRTKSNEFLVTCRSSFFRREVLDYLTVFEAWQPSQEFFDADFLIICPRAADKPYPAPIHSAIKKAVPNCYLMVATGVLGLVPEELWEIAPAYDSGLPFNERVYSSTLKFFSRYKHPHCTVYSDFLASWISEALVKANQPFKSVFDVQTPISRYYDLKAPHHLEQLQALCQK